MSHSTADLDSEVGQLKDRVRLLETMACHSSELIFTLDSESCISGLNEAAEHATGYPEEELTGRPFRELISPESAADGISFEAVLIGKNGAAIPVEIRKERRIVVAHDLSERQALEESSRQAQKMETLGILAGGIAHDFNNLLTGILGYAYLLQDEPALVAQYGEALDVIVKSSERAAQLTTQLLGFARHNKGPLAPVDLHLTIHEIVQLLHRTIDKKIRVSTHLLASRCHVLADASQLYQVLLNLCLNARDAMPDGGELRITTRNSGTGVVISVSDNGAGIPNDIRGRIFEPFFTTKAPQRGTGMGLAMVRAIARNHGGSVRLDSETASGTTFHVTFPVCRTASSAATPRKQKQMGTGRILVIEDEEFVRRVISRMLTGLGYDVFCSPDAHAGIEHFRKHYGSVDLVIVDLVMPAMNGAECLQALRDIDPNVRLILSSGYGDGEIQGVEFLPKPYQPEQLAGVVRRAIRRTAFRVSAN
jgi:two-component system, cell cycle sensor histidine kinase and response regulator CckA